ncbi:TIGR00725 family protein [Nioella halotolerans]|uniref:TIGR00725 family protein n=1 Tax=Nioella halotolerans TaxID=2303578 RepID=UPI0026A0477B
MSQTLTISSDGRLHDGQRCFDPWQWRWQEDATTSETCRTVTPREALAAICNRGGARRLPIGVIGPREATAAQRETASELGRQLAEGGLTVMCGGRGGVMASVAKGARAAGGLTIGILPEGDWRSANDDIVVPIATGLNEARNAVIARAAVALIAVGSSPGTMTEMAFGLHFGRPVIVLNTPAPIDGLHEAPDVATALDLLARHLLKMS